MTVSAFARIGILHRVPYILRQVQTFCIKFFWCINGAENLVEYFVTGLNLTYYFMYPWTWYVAVGTGSAYTTAISIVNGFLVFAENVFFHLMTGNTELKCIGHFHCSVETAPEKSHQQS